MRRYYYDPQGAISELKSQRRNGYDGDALNKVYENYYKTGAWSVPSNLKYDDNTPAPNVTDRSFTLPLPSSDVVYNPLLMEAPQDFDLSSIKF